MTKLILVSFIFTLFSIPVFAGGGGGGGGGGGISDPVVSGIIAGDYKKVKDLLSKKVFEKEKEESEKKYMNYESYKGELGFFTKLFTSDSSLKEQFEKGKSLNSHKYSNYESFLKTRLETKDEFGRTPLIWAAYLNYSDKKKSDELENGKKDEKDSAKDKKGRVHIVKLLLEKGAGLNDVDRDGWSALSWAAWSGMKNVVKILLNQDVKIDVADKNGQTPLMIAAYKGHVKIVENLIEKGADKKGAALLAKKGLSMNSSRKADYDKIITILQ